MKKQGLIRNTMIIAALALSLTACGSKNESGTTASDSGSKTATTTAQADTTAKNTEQASEAVTESGQTSENWFFKKGDVTIELNAPSEPIIQALGTAQNTYEAPSCAFDGMDVIYVYPGYEVLTYANDEKSVISGVVLRDDTVATPEGTWKTSTARKPQASAASRSTKGTVRYFSSLRTVTYPPFSTI